MTLSIDDMYAYIAIGPEGEGIAAAMMAPGWMPLVAADRARVDGLRPIAQSLADASGQRIALVKFSTREDLEILEPDPDGPKQPVVIINPEA